MAPADASSSSRSPSHGPELTRRLRRLGIRGKRLRRGWTRERITEVLQTLAWTIPLTLLLWVWAQDQQIEEQTVQNVRVNLVHVDPQLALTRIDGAATEQVTIPVTLTVRGPRSGLEEVLRPLREQAGVIDLPVDPLPADRLTIDLRRQMRDLERFEEAGVTLASVAPSTVDVRVERLGAMNIPVVAGGDLPPSEIVGEVVFNPRTVTVRGPERVLAALSRAAGPEGPRVEGRLPDSIGEGEQQVRVPVSLPDRLRSAVESVVGTTQARRLRIEPSAVEATVTRRAGELAEYEVPYVVVWFDKPAALEGRATVRLPDLVPPVLNNVRVRGPKAVVDQLRNEELNVRARLPLSPDDRLQIGQRLERQVVWEAPPEITVLSQAPQIAFVLEPLGE